MCLIEKIGDILRLTQLVIDIKDNRVVIKKMRQYKSGQAVQMFSMVFLET